ncbi:MAG: hypothetical protein RBT76_04615 [candidate division Zixibacteria bacterium]|jgi:hypothetical protein|nr:hypothetical protein [candidate division Zixibacteria bacterium]
MRFCKSVLIAVLTFALAAPVVLSQETEQDIINRYLQKTEKAQITKLGWASIHFSGNRINRHNDYNDFAINVSASIDGGEIAWLDQAFAFGADFGVVFKKKFAWYLGGEYWLKQGTNLSGDFTYTPPGGVATPVNTLVSEVKVYGVYTGFQYFLLNPPSKENLLTGVAVRANVSGGLYGVSWDLFPEYQNLNLSTSTSVQGNESYTGTAPGFSLGMGIDYPVNFWNMALGADLSYLYLNFNNVSWYNAQDEEIIATYDNTEDGRVDLALSGFRGKVELKRYFNW